MSKFILNLNILSRLKWIGIVNKSWKERTQDTIDTINCVQGQSNNYDFIDEMETFFGANELNVKLTSMIFSIGSRVHA